MEKERRGGGGGPGAKVVVFFSFQGWFSALATSPASPASLGPGVLSVAGGWFGVFVVRVGFGLGLELICVG